MNFTTNLEARLTERSTQQGRRPDEFVQDVVARYLDEEDRFIEAVKRGEDALERGEYLTHEQVGEGRPLRGTDDDPPGGIRRGKQDRERRLSPRAEKSHQRVVAVHEKRVHIPT